TQPVPALGNPPSFGLTAGTTYYLWDDQILPNGVPAPVASFYKSPAWNPSISGGDTPIGSSAGAGPVTYAPTSCTSNCYFKVQVSGVVNAFKYTATGSGPPPPPPPPPGSVAVNGPASGSPNVSYTYTAVTNGLHNITAYEWDFGDGSGGGSPPPPPPPGPCPPVQPNCGMGLSPKAAEAFSPGSQQQPHTFAAAGNFGVKVRVTAGGTTYTSPAFTVQIGTGGPPPPLNTFDVLGGAFNSLNKTWTVAAGNVITFTAGEPDPAATFAWDFGDGDTASGNVVTHVFRRADRFTVTLTVSGGGTSTSGISEGNA